jgi:hypothetical protein
MVIHCFGKEAVIFEFRDTSAPFRYRTMVFAASSNVTAVCTHCPVDESDTEVAVYD